MATTSQQDTAPEDFSQRLNTLLKEMASPMASGQGRPELIYLAAVHKRLGKLDEKLERLLSLV